MKNSIMKYMCIIIFCLLLVGSGLLMAEITFAENIENLQGFDMISADEGWIWMNRHIYWTKTGGRDWINISPLNLGQAIIRAVSFLDTQYGWLMLTDVDETGNIAYSTAKTSDGGKTWQIRPLSLFESGDINALAEAVYVHFIDSQVGWVVIKRATSSNFSVGTLFKTTDGGNTWTQLSIPIGEPVYFVTSEIGWIAGGAAGDEFYRTQDGGMTWHSQTIVRPTTGNISQRHLYQLPTFENINDGVLPVMITDGDTTQVEFYVTNDSGESWNLATRVPVDREIAPGSPLPLTVFDTRRWLIVAPNSNQLLKTSNRTDTTMVMSQDRMTAGITKLDMVTPGVGWAEYNSGNCAPVAQANATSLSSPQQSSIRCTSETRLLRTNDGGQTWIRLNLPQSEVSETMESFPASDTTNSIPHLGSHTQNFVGQGFDKCEIPSLSQLQNWVSNSPYRAVNLYIGGSSRGCPNSALTASYISQIKQQGWRLIPTWVGPQAACSGYRSRMSYNPTTAYNQGASEANAASDVAANLGLTGTIIYYDLENYNTTDTACRNAAKSFISGWTAQLHARGNQSGVYGSACGSAISDFASISNVPDAVWPAHWLIPYQYRSDATVWNVLCLSNNLWNNHQRIRQYAGGHNETWGGLTLNIDSNVIDGIVAYQAQSSCPEHLSIEETISSGQRTFQAGQTIEAHNRISGGATVTYRAGQEIRLTAGFTAGNGSTFHALIGACQ